MVIVVSGMMGAGKTTYTAQLAEWYQLNKYFERVEDNQWLERFYQQPQKWALHLQLFFLHDRYRVMQKVQTQGNTILDRSIFEDVVYAQTYRQMEYMSAEDYELYEEILTSFMQSMEGKYPDLLLYLTGSFETIIERITQRGRQYECLDKEKYHYYQKLYQAYENWYASYSGPKLAIDIDRFDILERPEEVRNFIEQEGKKKKSA